MSFETGFMTTLGVIAAVGVVILLFVLIELIGDLLMSTARLEYALGFMIAGALGMAFGDPLTAQVGKLGFVLGVVMAIFYVLKKTDPESAWW